MDPKLSVAVVAGPCRARAQRVVDGFCAQTIVDSTEILIVDIAPAEVPRLTFGEGAPVRYLSRPEVRRWGQARAVAIHEARTPLVAFVEDHCFPSRTWAEKVLEAHAGPWAAVGYAFTNANPRTYLSRAAMLARYGQFAHPARGGPAALISGNNVSYRRDALLELGDRLEPLLDVDFNLHEELKRRGRRLYVQAEALAAHQNYNTLAGECRTGRPYCRVMAAHRAGVNGWGTPRRLLYGVLCPVSAPALRLLRLAAGLRGRSRLWPGFLAGLPMIVAMYVSDAWGESAGYLFGAGSAERDVLRYELETERDT